MTAAERRRLIRRGFSGFYAGRFGAPAGGPGTHGGAGAPPPTDLAVNTPPPGSYDPSLDYDLQTSQIGLGDLETDTARADRLAERDQELALGGVARGRRRSMVDLRQTRSRGLFDIHQNLDRGVEDIGTRRNAIGVNFARDMQDLAIANQRGGEDAARATAALTRKYGTMAEAQSEGAAQSGVSSTRGGFAAQSAEKRTANQGVEQAPIDTARSRQVADIGLRTGRLGEDRTNQLANLFTSEGRLRSDAATSQQRLGEDFRTQRFRTRKDARLQSADINRQASRDARTRDIELSRGERDQALYELAQHREMYFAAQQSDPQIRFPTLEDLRHGVNRRGHRIR